MELNTKVAKNAMGVAKNAIKTGDWVYLKKDPSKTTLVVDEVRASGQFRVTDIPGAWFTEKDVEIVKKSANAAPIAANAIACNSILDTPNTRKFLDWAQSVFRAVKDNAGADKARERVLGKLKSDATMPGDEKRKVAEAIYLLHGQMVRGLRNSHPLKTKVAQNAVACNDKWIDDFHVIVTAEKPDLALVDALKKKAAAWKAYKRNFSDKAAGEAHEKAKHDVATVAKRLGAKLEQIGAVLRVVMPNAVVKNDSAELLGKLNKMLKHSAVSVAAGGNPSAKDVIHFKYRGKPYYVGKDEAHMIKQFEDAGLITRAANAATNAKFKVGDKVQLKGGNRTGKIVGGLGAYDKDSHPDCVTVRWDSYGFDVPVKPENLTVANSASSSKVANRAINWNYKNKYQFFCVDPSLAKPCIHSGWDYKEDAKEDAQELKELKIPYKIVSRRFLEQSGVDPNNGDWWKKGR